MSAAFYKDNMNIKRIGGYTLQQVARDVWAIDEFGIDIMYLILGSEKGLLLDTGIGAGNIRAVIKEMTDLPVIVVNSHHHYDHAGGNGQFEVVYAHEKAIDTIIEQNNRKTRKDFFASQEARSEYNHEACLKTFINQASDYELKSFTEGHLFDLGDRQLEVIFTPGHTKDSICLLDRGNKLLFSADTIVSTPTLILDTFSDTLSAYLNSLKKLKELKSEYELIFPGHYLRPIGERYVEDMIECVQHILANPYIGEEDECKMAKGRVYFYQYQLASVLYTADRAV